MAKHPLAVNFKTLEQYNIKTIKLDEIILFEWLILKTYSFGNSNFFYQQDRTIQELGIKIHRLTKIKELFKSYGLIIYTAGLNNATYYTVTETFLKSFTNNHIKKEIQEDFLNRLNNFSFSEKKIDDFDKQEIEDLISELNKLYNDRRKQEQQKECSIIEYPYTELSVNKKTYNQLHKLVNQYDFVIIKNSFTAFSDALIRKEDTTLNALNNFSSYNSENDSFPVFERYLNKFNLEYAITKNTL